MTQPEKRQVRFGGERTPGEYVFELTGGRLCLDLANTRDERKTDHPRELLPGYDELADWATQSGAVSPTDGSRLRRYARDHPIEAAAALSRVTDAREIIFAVFSAVATGHAVAKSDLEALNRLAARAQARRKLEPESGGAYRWGWRPSEQPDLDRPLHAAVLAAAELLPSPDLARVRQCEGAGCAWLFMDTSKNGSRRWCDMSVCGNRAKARRHRSKSKE